MKKEDFKPGTKFRIWSRSSEVFVFAPPVSKMADGFLNVLTIKTGYKEAVAFYSLADENINFYNAKRFMGGYQLVEFSVSLDLITVVEELEESEELPCP